MVEFIGSNHGDKISIATPKNRIKGGDGADDVTTGSGVDNIDSGGGDDKIDAGSGKDIVQGGPGNDLLFGGGGADVFVFGAGSGADVIADFEDGIDRIDLSSLGFSNAGDVLKLARQSGKDVEIDFGNGDTLIIKNIDLSQLSHGDFIL